VPPPPPPLLPPQAICELKPANSTVPIATPRSLFLLLPELNPIPTSATPKIGNTIAYIGLKLPSKFGRMRTAVAAVVVIVNVDVACPPLVNVACAGLNEHVGANDGAGDTAQVNATVPVNPPVDPTVTVAVADCPAITELGVVEDGPEMLKAGGAGFTSSVGCTPNRSLPDVPTIVSAYFPRTAETLGVTVTVELVPLEVGTTLAGFAVQVPANGRGHVIATIPVKPFVVVAVTVKVVG
jgi:hypothetical protein